MNGVESSRAQLAFVPTGMLFGKRFDARNRGLDWEEQQDAFLMVDVRGRIIDHSAAAAELLAYSENGLLGMQISQILPELPFAVDTPYYNLAYAVFNTDHEVQTQHSAVTQDGKSIMVNVSVSSVAIKGRRLIFLALQAVSRSERSWEKLI